MFTVRYASGSVKEEKKGNGKAKHQSIFQAMANIFLATQFFMYDVQDK